MPSRPIVGSLLALAALAASTTLGLAAETVRLRPVGLIMVDGTGEDLRQPEGVACGPSGIAVADTRNGRIATYAVEARTVRPLETWALPELPAPLKIRYLANGDLLVLDERSLRIARLDAKGEFQGWLEPHGEGVEKITPRSFAVGPEDRVYVLDIGSWRVLVVDPKGAVERSIAFAPETGFLSDLTVDGRGTVYAVDSVARRVQAARQDQDTLAPITPPLIEDVDFPTAIVVDDEGRLFVVDEHGGGVVILGRDGSFRGRQLAMGWKEGYVRYPAAICIDGRGLLYLAERGNSRVQMFEIR